MPRKKKEEKKEETKQETETPLMESPENSSLAKEEQKEPAKIEEIREKAKVEKLDLESLKNKGKEIEGIIVKLANEGMTASKIGIVLRDSYGIPSVKIMDKKIGKVLAENKLNPKIPEDLVALEKKSENLKNHLGKNKQDKKANRGLQVTNAKIVSLSNYFKKKGILPKD